MSKKIFVIFVVIFVLIIHSAYAATMSGIPEKKIHKNDNFILNITLDPNDEVAIGAQMKLKWNFTNNIIVNNIIGGDIWDSLGHDIYYENGTIYNNGSTSYIYSLPLGYGGVNKSGTFIRVNITTLKKGKIYINITDLIITGLNTSVDLEDTNSVYYIPSVPINTIITIVPRWDIDMSGYVTRLDLWDVLNGIGSNNFTLDVDNDHDVDFKDATLVAQHMGERTID